MSISLWFLTMALLVFAACCSALVIADMSWEMASSRACPYKIHPLPPGRRFSAPPVSTCGVRAGTPHFRRSGRTGMVANIFAVPGLGAGCLSSRDTPPGADLRPAGEKTESRPPLRLGALVVKREVSGEKNSPAGIRSRVAASGGASR